MIVIVVIAILAAVALPSYLNQTRKARRSEVEGAMQQVALVQERFRADCTTYATDFSYACPTGTPPTFPALNSFYTSPYYTLTIVAASTGATTYKMQAVPVGTQAKDAANGSTCATLTYDYGATTAGVVTQTTSTANTACWAK